MLLKLLIKADLFHLLGANFYYPTGENRQNRNVTHKVILVNFS